MRPFAVPGVAGLLLGRRGRERAQRSGVVGAGAGRERASVDCSAMVVAAECWCGWYARLALQYCDTALITAAYKGEMEAMALLLDRGADLEARDNVSASGAPSTCQPVGVVRGRVAASCSA